MLPVDSAAARSFSTQRAPKPQVDAAQDDAATRTQDRAPALRRTALHQALYLSDDFTALGASFGLRRSQSAEADGGDVRDAAWLDHVLDPKGPQKLAALKLQLQQLPVRDAAALRALISGLFPDPSDAVAVLRLLLSEAELEEIRAELAEVHDQLLQSAGQDGRPVKAGLNVALKARLHASPLKATAAQLRQSYRDFIGCPDPLESYALWLELYGFERRHRVVAFIQSALTADMYALDPGCSRLEFGQLLQRVRQLTTLRSADHLMMTHCWDAVTMGRLGIDAPMLLSALLRMMRQQGGIGQLLSELFARARHALDLADKRRIAQRMRRFLKALPHALWPDIGLQTQADDDVDALLAQALRHERAQSAGTSWKVV